MASSNSIPVVDSDEDRPFSYFTKAEFKNPSDYDELAADKSFRIIRLQKGAIIGIDSYIEIPYSILPADRLTFNYKGKDYELLSDEELAAKLSSKVEFKPVPRGTTSGVRVNGEERRLVDGGRRRYRLTKRRHTKRRKSRKARKSRK